MGIVFAARHLGLDEVVAIKFVRPDVQDAGGALARFAREAKLAARIHSEHVAKVFDVGVLEPFGPFIVMEYLEGSSLAELLEAEGPLPPQRFVGYLLQACEALAAVHAIGVVHRDVKPDNLFVTRRAGAEVVRLLDFGIAQVLPNGPALAGDESNGSSFVLGSPLYMAPEQLRPSSPVDARADIWALGVVSYELLSGRMPFAGASLPEICATILDAEPAPLGAVCPAELAQVVMRCLAKDPTQRFGSVAELAAALLPLAPRDAHSYASRASSILRASSAMPVEALLAPSAPHAPGPGRAAPGPDTEISAPSRGLRFQSSALVASATILALAALGVVAALSRGDTPEPAPAAAPSMALGPPALAAHGEPVIISASAADESLVWASGSAPLAGEVPAPMTTSDSPQAVLASELPAADALASPLVGGGPAAAVEPAAPAGPELARLLPAATPSTPTRRVRARRAAAAEAKMERQQAAPRRRAATRVRLVEPPARPRLVKPELPVSRAR